MKKYLITAAAVALFGACAEADDAVTEPAINDEYGKPTLEVDPFDAGKADTFDGNLGPRTSGISSDTEVWPVTTRWYKTDPAAGLAWGADTDLTWDEKFALWVDSLPKLQNGSRVTFTMTTPWGKSLPSPSLECAETAIFLRATFASWYGLPFYLSARGSNGTVYYGHFGIIDANGHRLSGYPRFKRDYRDYTAEVARLEGDELTTAWPKDDALRKRYLTTLKDDRNPWLGEDAYAGAYFDEVFANKRTGHFMLRLLTNFGSMHLAGATNTFNLAPEAVRAGDVLIERWQRQGIGHVLVVKNVTPTAAGKLAVEAMYGSMPRIQPRWYDADLSKPYFTSELTGGEGANYDGDKYAAMGGGLKRWRTPVEKNGRWYNIVPVADREVHVDSADLDAIAARPGIFEELMGSLTPEEERDVILRRVEEARENLKMRPASCANRQRREEAFAELYTLSKEAFGDDRAMVDETYRTLDDYVFAELVYDKSKTCCWNRSTDAMYLVVMLYNEQLMREAHADGVCVEPAVFKAEDGGYERFAKFADEIGEGAAWVAWSEDETCPARDVVEDTEVDHSWTDFCDIRDALTDDM